MTSRKFVVLFLTLFLAAGMSCRKEPTEYPLSTQDLCCTHPQFCRPYAENCARPEGCGGGMAVVCCTEEQGCVAWEHRRDEAMINQRLQVCQGTLGLCHIALGDETNAQGQNPVVCYDFLK